MEAFLRVSGSCQVLAANSNYDTVAKEEEKVHKSGLHKATSQRQIICPEPRRMPSFRLFRDGTPLIGCRSESDTSLQNTGEAVCEILDIFFTQSLHGEQPSPYFSGSPPNRSENPLIHDVQFKKKVMQPSMNVSQKSSCGAKCGSSPSVRVDGFVCSSSEKRCIVSAFA